MKLLPSLLALFGLVWAITLDAPVLMIAFNAGCLGFCVGVTVATRIFTR